ncbi:MAG: hypothetical protein D6719_04090 [Candidatus Dadabacteria bacterium]|nr:MAG: hypothetical protein D6719_04090 [Candidatus Dadabacteria bacterium]
MYRIVLFDIDATLIKCGDAARRAVRAAVEESFGVDSESCWSDVPKHGRTDPLIIKDLCELLLCRRLTQTELNGICNAYLEKLEKLIDDTNGYKVLPGAAALLNKLAKNDSILLGLQTGNLEKGAFLKLKPSGFGVYFSFGGYGSDSTDRAEIVRTALRRGEQRVKKHKDLLRPVLIGDTIHDIDAGRVNSVFTIGVATGIYSAGELKKAGADLVVDNLSDTDKITGLITQL